MRKAIPRGLRAASDERGIAGIKRARGTRAAEIYAGGGYRGIVGGADSAVGAGGGKTVLYRGSAVSLGTGGAWESRDFRKWAGAFGGLAGVADIGCCAWAGCGTLAAVGEARPRAACSAARRAVESSVGRTDFDCGSVAAGVCAACRESQGDCAGGVQRARRCAFGVFGSVGGGGDAREARIAAVGRGGVS